MPSENDIYFCLDCERCKSKNCNHRNHARKLISRPTEHIVNYGHGRFQKESDFLKFKPKLHIQDLAYNSEHGAVVRKRYKKYASENEESSPVNLFDYPSERRCNISNMGLKLSY